jgi:hypothetical protein
VAKVDETLLLDVVEEIEALSVQLGVETRHLWVDYEGMLAFKVDEEMNVWVLDAVELTL